MASRQPTWGLTVPKEQQGLKEVGTGLSQADVHFDLVVVHDLGEIPDDAWRNAETGFDWVSDGLPRDLSDARIMKFGYDSRKVVTGQLSYNLESVIAVKLLQGLSSRRKNIVDWPIIFVGQGLGSVIIEKALCYAKGVEAVWGHILQATIGICFLERWLSPDTISHASIFTRIGMDSPMSADCTISNWFEQEDNTTCLAQVTNQFSELINSTDAPDLSIVCFMEQHYGSRGADASVDGLSACFGHAATPSHRKVSCVGSRHTFGKFPGPRDATYEVVLSELRKLQQRQSSVELEAPTNDILGEVATEDMALATAHRSYAEPRIVRSLPVTPLRTTSTNSNGAVVLPRNPFQLPRLKLSERASESSFSLTSHYSPVSPAPSRRAREQSSPPGGQPRLFPRPFSSPLSPNSVELRHQHSFSTSDTQSQQGSNSRDSVVCNAPTSHVHEMATVREGGQERIGDDPPSYDGDSTIAEEEEDSNVRDLQPFIDRLTPKCRAHALVDIATLSDEVIALCPLYTAALVGEYGVATQLLDQGEDVNFISEALRYGFPLQAAARVGDDLMIKILLKAGADAALGGGIFGSALVAATWQGCADGARLLLKAGAPVDHCYSPDHQTALLHAVADGNKELATILLEAGADVDQLTGNRPSPVQLAIVAGNTSMLTLLMEWHPDLSIAGDEEAQSLTPMQLAASKGRHDAIDVLLSNFAPIGYCSGEGAPLEIAVRQGHLSCVQLLLEKGAEINLMPWEQDGFLPDIRDAMKSPEENYQAIADWVLAYDAFPNLMLSSTQELPLAWTVRRLMQPGLGDLEVTRHGFHIQRNREQFFVWGRVIELGWKDKSSATKVNASASDSDAEEETFENDRLYVRRFLCVKPRDESGWSYAMPIYRTNGRDELGSSQWRLRVASRLIPLPRLRSQTVSVTPAPTITEEALARTLRSAWVDTSKCYMVDHGSYCRSLGMLTSSSLERLWKRLGHITGAE